MWKGGISFGLVMIPVRLYAATEQKDIAFRQVHRADGGRIRFRRFCSVCGEEVPYEDVVKGYELSTGEMVILDDEDLADLPLPTTKSIEVLHFAPSEQLDPILFNRSYFVEPETAGARAYVLLRDALEQSGRIAIAQVALRQRESLATLRTRDGVLVLETLLWPDEVREASFPFLEQDIEVRPQELTMASSLIDSMTSDFDPDAHHDGYREALAEVVEAKIAGHELTQPGPVEVAAGPSTSLADALRASLAAAQQAPAVGESEQAKAIGDGSKSGAAKSRAAKGGSAKSATAKSGAAAADKDQGESDEDAPAKAGAGKAKSSRTKSGAAKPARKAS
ncbi:MAG: Ku protein [Nocardiopsaceae bacterium]|jgi:DNA end-binding protein Ku|nr:Ku protein [Nocardiopsaceae bacterium]